MDITLTAARIGHHAHGPQLVGWGGRRPPQVSRANPSFQAPTYPNDRALSNKNSMHVRTARIWWRSGMYSRYMLVPNMLRR
jgi:hypothetical protein